MVRAEVLQVDIEEEPVLEELQPVPEPEPEPQSETSSGIEVDTNTENTLNNSNLPKTPK